MKKVLAFLVMLAMINPVHAGDWSEAFNYLRIKNATTEPGDNSLASKIFRATIDIENEPIRFEECDVQDCSEYLYDLTNGAKKGIYDGVPKRYQADMNPAIYQDQKAVIKLNNAKLWGKSINNLQMWSEPETDDFGFIVEFGEMGRAEFSQFKRSIRFAKYKELNECSGSEHPASLYQDDLGVVYLALDWGC